MILPDKYKGLSDEELSERIAKVKTELGDRLAILGHHYQRDEVFRFADFVGDSFKLAQDAARQKAENIVFCGVHFMAEAARIVCKKEQHVFLPDTDAGCPMADLADINDVEDAWNDLAKVTDVKKIIPVTYMNSTAAIKAFCGRNGGIVCTSSNAKKIFEWAFTKGEKIFFLPDEHLGTNTAYAMGIKEVGRWGGIADEKIAKNKVIVWNGYCHVHTFFTVDDVRNAREKYPSAKIIVHPECKREVVEASDESGSTEQIIKYVKNAPAGSTIIIGTEINMVSRLANEHKDKTVMPLTRSLCPNMFKISLGDLCWTLEELGKVNEIFVDEKVTKDAALALNRMLENT